MAGGGGGSLRASAKAAGKVASSLVTAFPFSLCVCAHAAVARANKTKTNRGGTTLHPSSFRGPLPTEAEEGALKPPPPPPLTSS